MVTLSGLNGERPRAISSALTNSWHPRISGNTVKEAVVLPAPLQPAMMYSCLDSSIGIITLVVVKYFLS